MLPPAEVPGDAAPRLSASEAVVGHTHTAFKAPVAIRRRLALASALAALATAIGLIALWPPADPLAEVDSIGMSSEVFDATVESVREGPCEGGSPGDADCRTATIRLRQGPHKGDSRTLDLPSGRGPAFGVGDTVVVSYEPTAPEGLDYGFADRNRKAVLWWLAALFAVTVVALGRLRGLAALGGLAASFVVLLKFILPAVWRGQTRWPSQ